MAKLLDSKLIGLARTDDVKKINNKVDQVSAEIEAQKKETAQLKSQVQAIKSSAVTPSNIANTVREELDKPEREKKPTAVTALAPLNNTIDLVSSASSSSSTTSLRPGASAASCWGGSSGGSSTSVFLAGASSKEQEDARRSAFELSLIHI